MAREERRGVRLTYGKKAELDEKDWAILRLLAQNARMPVSSIARKLGLKRELVKYRISNLIREGIITSFVTIVDLPKLGYTTWGYMYITFKDLTAEKQREFVEYVRKSPNILFAHSTLGAWDFGLEFFARDPGHFYDLQMELKEKFAGIIKDYESGSFIDIYKLTYVPEG